MKILLANPRGFCAGVDRAIDIVNRALDSFGAPIYVRHEVVHNQYVVDTLRERGAVFVDELDEIPDDQIVIFSAHGVSKAVRQEAESRQLKIFDATCPLVTKVHIEVYRYCKQGFDLILIGHHGHPEVEGTLGQWDKLNGQGTIYLVDSVKEARDIKIKQPEKIAYVT
ncbi:MAG: 4-hydroxy-3-methylbut-2-enyl diphosphate reductase, partial [Marinicella sp.]